MQKKYKNSHLLNSYLTRYLHVPKIQKNHTTCSFSHLNNIFHAAEIKNITFVEFLFSEISPCTKNTKKTHDLLYFTHK